MKYSPIKQLVLLFICAISTLSAVAQKTVKIAAAANLRYALSEIENLYESKNSDIDLQINYGASGTFYQQIVNGAPFELFLSADDILPQKLKEAKVTDSESRIYACGKLAIYSLSYDIHTLGIELLESPKIGRIAIANPRTAPYGTRSLETLKSLNLWDKLERRVVYGDSIAQTAQFAMSGNCDLGFVALSLLLKPDSELKGSYYIIPENLYKPIAQAGIVLKDGQATKFFDFILSPECKSVWDKYGYSTPQ